MLITSGGAFPSVATDRAGRIYVTWPDCRFRPSCSRNDMVLTTSADGGHWTPVTRIPIDPVTSPVDHLGGGLGVDPVTAGRHARHHALTGGDNAMTGTHHPGRRG